MRRSVRFFLCSTLGALVCAAGAQTTTYLALGDSITWGWIMNQAQPSNGDKQGYVHDSANWMAGQTGTRPKVIDLGIPGEMTTSYNDISNQNRSYNTNYNLNPVSQSVAMSNAVSAEASAHRTIAYVSFALGINDLLKLHNQQFWSLPADQQRAVVDKAVVACQKEIQTELDDLRSKLPKATLMVPNYYNPYRANNDPAFPTMEYGLVKLNAILEQQALSHNGISIDVYSRFYGQEGQLTNILQGDIHPNAAGYQVIADLIINKISPDLLSVKLNSSSVVSGSTGTATVTLSDFAGTGGSLVKLSTASAVLSVPSSLSIPAGSKSGSFTISTQPVGSSVTRYVFVAMKGITKVLDVPLSPTLTVSGLSSPSQIKGGQSATCTVTLNMAAPSGGTVVSISTGSAALKAPASVTVNSGATSVSFTLTAATVSQSYTRTLKATLNGFSKTVAITITP